MPGRTEVEQMHKIFKLCGSPSEDYWQRTKFPHATSFKPQHPYKRNIAETFINFSSPALALVDKLLAIEPQDRGSATSALKSEFFTTNPPPCDPSSLPKFPPSKEFDAKRRDKEAIRKNTEAVKGRGLVSVIRGAGDTKVLGSPEYNARGNISVQISDSSRKNPDLRTHSSHVSQVADFSASSIKKEQGMSGREHGMTMIHIDQCFLHLCFAHMQEYIKDEGSV